MNEAFLKSTDDNANFSNLNRVRRGNLAQKNLLLCFFAQNFFSLIDRKKLKVQKM